jgi:hypothetical protein
MFEINPLGRVVHGSREWCVDVGMLAQDVTEEVLREIAEENNRGWKISNNKIQANGTDITINDVDNKKTCKLELHNMGNFSFYDETRACRECKNVRGTPYKGIIHYGNLFFEGKSERIIKNIPQLHIPFQIVPRKYYGYLISNDLMSHRKIDSVKTRKLIKTYILGFLIKIRFLTLVYYVSCINVSDRLVSCVSFVVDVSFDSVGLIDNVCCRVFTPFFDCFIELRNDGRLTGRGCVFDGSDGVGCG